MAKQLSLIGEIDKLIAEADDPCYGCIHDREIGLNDEECTRCEFYELYEKEASLCG